MVNDREPRYRHVDADGNVVGSLFAEADGTLKLQEGTSGNDNEVSVATDGTFNAPAVDTEQAAIDSRLADAVIYDDSGTYRAMGPSGVGEIASGSDIGAVLQSVHDNDSIIDPNSADSPGGLIQVRQGDYNSSTTTTFTKHSVYFFGAGNGLDRTTEVSGGTKITADAGHTVIEWDGTSEKIRGGGIKDVHLVGNSRTSGDGVMATRVDLLRIDNVTAEEFQNGYDLRNCDAAHINHGSGQECGTGLYASNCLYLKVIGGEYSDNDNNGIVVDRTSSKRPKLLGPTAVRNGANVKIINGVKQPRLIGVDAEDNSGLESILLWDDGQNAIEEPVLVGCHIQGNNDLLKLDGVEGGSVNNCTFEGDSSADDDVAVQVAAATDFKTGRENTYHNTVNTKFSDSGIRTRLGGVAKQALGGSAPSTPKNWDAGDVVEDTDNPGDAYVKLPSSGFTQIST